MGDTIVMDFGDDGSFSMEGKGFAGPECTKALAQFSAALGEQVSSKPTAEFFARPRQTTVKAGR